MAKPASVAAYFSGLDGDGAIIARALKRTINQRWPRLSVKLAWGFPCWSGNERVFSIISHGHRCNLQLWQGARLAEDYLARIEGTGKALRHVKVYMPEQVDDELIDIMESAVRLDVAEPRRVR